MNLKVPFPEKDEAKRLGARWDGAGKVWFVPPGMDTAPFARWIDSAPNAVASHRFNVRCNRFYIAKAEERCWHCQRETHVFTFLLPQGWDSLVEDGEHAGRWMREEHEVFLWRITRLGDAAIAAMHEHTFQYSLASSKGYLSEKFFNHCGHCQMKLREPGSGGNHVFQPDCYDAGERISLAYYNAPFEASCHYQDTQASIAFHAMHQLHDEETRFLCADERPAQDLAVQNSPTTQGHDRTSRDFDRAEVECVQL